MKPDKKIPSIPDGSSGKHVAVCLFNYDTISSNTDIPWSFTLQTTPTLPIGSVISSVDPLRISGRNVAPNMRFPMSIAPAFLRRNDYAGVPGSITLNSDVYDAATFRIVSIRYKLVYTGPAVNAAGSLLAYPTGLSFQPIGECTSTTVTGAVPPPTGRYGVVKNSLNDATKNGYCRIGTDVVYADGIKTAGHTTFPPSTTSFRPEQRIVVVPRHKTSTYRNIPLRDTPLLVTTAATLTGDTVAYDSWVTSTLDDGSGWYSGVMGYDEDWESVIIDAHDLNPDASFLLESCMCVEFCPKPTSSFYALANDSVNKPAVMAQVLKHQTNANAVFNEMNM